VNALPRLAVRCPDCQAAAGQPHASGCDVARCMATGLQRISCDGEHGEYDDHGCGQDRWLAGWPGMDDADRYGVTLNELRPPAFLWSREFQRWLPR